MGMFDQEWMKAWQEAVNRDRAMEYVRRFMNTDFVVGFGDTEYLVSVRGGKVEGVSDQWTIQDTWDFALRGPRESWAKFVQPVPPPMYNDIWAMAHPLHGRLRMEGNVKVLWQHLRPMTWMLDHMRELQPVSA
jgi:hypothetical protein